MHHVCIGVTCIWFDVATYILLGVRFRYINNDFIVFRKLFKWYYFRLQLNVATPILNLYLRTCYLTKCSCIISFQDYISIKYTFNERTAPCFYTFIITQTIYVRKKPNFSIMGAYIFLRNIYFLNGEHLNLYLILLFISLKLI